MQINLYLSTDEPVKLPVHYSSQVQGMIYKAIDSPEVRSYLHREGFPLEKRRFKLFTFSRLIAEKTAYDKHNKVLIMTPPIRLVISSPVSTILQEMATGFLKQKRVRIGKVYLKVEEIITVKPEVSKNNVKVRMLSPLTVYSTLPTPDGRKYTYYYSPYEDSFCEKVGDNLEKKKLLVHGALDVKNSFSIKPVNVKDKDFKVTRYRDFIVKGWMGEYEIEGEPDMLQLALETGLGSKNSQGFGCCELVE